MGSTQAPSGFVAFPALSSSSFDGSLVGRRGKSVLTANAAACDLCRPRDSRMQLASPQTQIGRPKTSIKKNVGNVNAPQQPEPETGRGAAKARPSRKTQADEIPMYKVILLGDEEYEEGHVVTQLQKITQISKGEAIKAFNEAQATGASVICVVPEEHAEFYAQQLRRADIFVTIEKDE